MNASTKLDWIDGLMLLVGVGLATLVRETFGVGWTVGWLASAVVAIPILLRRRGGAASARVAAAVTPTAAVSSTAEGSAAARTSPLPATALGALVGGFAGIFLVQSIEIFDPADTQAAALALVGGAVLGGVAGCVAALTRARATRRT